MAWPTMLDLHACRDKLKTWMSTQPSVGTTRRFSRTTRLFNKPFFVLPGHQRNVAQHNASRYAYIATTLDKHISNDVINICAAYSDVEPPYIEARAREARMQADSNVDGGSNCWCGSHNTHPKSRQKRPRADTKSECVARVKKSKLSDHGEG